MSTSSSCDNKKDEAREVAEGEDRGVVPDPITGRKIKLKSKNNE